MRQKYITFITSDVFNVTDSVQNKMAALIVIGIKTKCKNGIMDKI